MVLTASIFDVIQKQNIINFDNKSSIFKQHFTMGSHLFWRSIHIFVKFIFVNFLRKFLKKIFKNIKKKLVDFCLFIYYRFGPPHLFGTLDQISQVKLQWTFMLHPLRVNLIFKFSYIRMIQNHHPNPVSNSKYLAIPPTL